MACDDEFWPSSGRACRTKQQAEGTKATGGLTSAWSIEQCDCWSQDQAVQLALISFLMSQDEVSCRLREKGTSTVSNTRE